MGKKGEPDGNAPTYSQGIFNSSGKTVRRESRVSAVNGVGKVESPNSWVKLTHINAKNNQTWINKNIRVDTVKLVKENRENVSCHWSGQYFKNVIPKLQAVKTKMTNGIA